MKVSPCACASERARDLCIRACVRERERQGEGITKLKMRVRIVFEKNIIKISDRNTLKKVP